MGAEPVSIADITKDPFPKPTPITFIVPPPPPEPEARRFWGVSKAQRQNYEEQVAAWVQEKERIERLQYAVNAMLHVLIDYENTIIKRNRLKTRIDELEQEQAAEIASRDYRLSELEDKTVRGFAEYQLKRDYWGEMDKEVLLQEYRSYLLGNPENALLRESTNDAVIALVGDLNGLPLLTSMNERKRELDNLRSIFAHIEKYRVENEDFQSRYFEVIRYRRSKGTMGQSLTYQQLEYFFSCSCSYQKRQLHWHSRLLGDAPVQEDITPDKIKAYRLRERCGYGFS